MRRQVDALDPADLRQLFAAAIEPYWADDAYAEVLEREEEDRARLRKVVA